MWKEEKVRKLSIYEKKSTIAGSATMAAWVAIMGIGLIMSCISGISSSVLQAVTSNNQSKSTYSYLARRSSMIRISAFPSRSAINFYV